MGQLRHMRAANQVSSLSAFLDDYEGPKYRDAFNFVRTDLAKRLEDPEFRRELREGRLDRHTHPEITVCNFFEQWGMFFRIGAIDARFMTALKVAAGFWDLLEPVVAITAERTGGVNIVFENFVFLASKRGSGSQSIRTGRYPPTPHACRWSPPGTTQPGRKAAFEENRLADRNGLGLLGYAWSCDCLTPSASSPGQILSSDRTARRRFAARSTNR
jgi:hypothetical protein